MVVDINAPHHWRAAERVLGEQSVRSTVRNTGVKRAVISSDCGQPHDPPMIEALRITCQLLLEEEFTVEEIKHAAP
jgi:hypothetical protein